ncbi:hypothetical protein CBS101457_001009 [Exobasidium rhododendri]|nr:hypothetical protein CBS101457_001009 [Exobasidium rhododendri]
MYPIVDIPIPPALTQDAHRAAKELMDTLLMRYVPQLSGVLLTHRNISFLRSHARIDADGAYSIAPAGLTCLVWAPQIGMRLEGQIKLSTPSHISLLVHGIFNASITSAHLPSNTEPSNSHKDARKEDLEDDVGEKSTGYWENEKTGERLGGTDGKVVFTVVGITIANHMLSIFGSILRKPFSIPAPTYVPILTTPLSISLSDSDRRVRFQEEHQARVFSRNEEEDEGASEDDELPNLNNAARPEVVQKEPAKKKKSKVGPRRELETSGSESEGESKREKKRRKKEANQ